MAEKLVKEMDLTKFQWTREPESCVTGPDSVCQYAAYGMSVEGT